MSLFRHDLGKRPKSGTVRVRGQRFHWRRLLGREATVVVDGKGRQVTIVEIAPEGPVYGADITRAVRQAKGWL